MNSVKPAVPNGLKEKSSGRNAARNAPGETMATVVRGKKTDPAEITTEDQPTNRTETLTKTIKMAVSDIPILIRVAHAEAKRISSTLLILSLLFPLSLMAQNKRFTLEDLIPGGKNYAKMVPQTIHTAWWGNKLLKIERDSISQWDGKGGWSRLFARQEMAHTLSAL